MRIKTFEAPTLQDALDKARRELGEDAVVLNTRYVKSTGLLGIRSTPKVELTAAVQSEGPVSVKADSGPDRTHSIATNESSCRSSDNPLLDGDYSARVQMASENTAGRCAGSSRDESILPDIADIKWELRRLGLIVENLLAERMSVSPCARPPEQVQTPLLVRAGVEADIVYKQLADLVHFDDLDKLIRLLASKLESFVRPFDYSNSRVVALVGPTGAGKTTTLAKLAAKFSLEQGKDVALVTVDTYRIGAVDQLRTYARIIGIPLEVAFSPADVAAAVDRHRNRNLVLIDTVGRSQRSEEQLRELKAFLEAADGVETHLVVSAALSPDVQYEVVERFSIFSPKCLIITKLDEVSNLGVLVNLPFRSGLPVSCTTSGQNVPNDLSIPDANKMATAVLGCITAEVAR